MELRQVFSSHVAALGYDPNTLELWVKFRTGKTAVYMGVPSDVAKLVVDAPSVGTALNSFVKGKFAFGYKTEQS